MEVASWTSKGEERVRELEANGATAIARGKGVFIERRLITSPLVYP